MVPENHGLSSPVRDSWESTHPCNDHFELKSKNKKKVKKGTRLWLDHKWATGWTFRMPVHACPKRLGSFGYSTDFLMRKSERSDIDLIRKL